MNEANRTAFEKLTGARPMLIGCGTAGEVMPGFRKNLILHSGPPVEFGNMRGPHRMGIVGAAMLEGLARDEKEAVGMIESGEIELGCANDFHSGGPGAGITSYSMAMLVVREKNSGTLGFAAPIEGALGGGLGGWGVYNDSVRENLKRIAGIFAPLLDRVLKQSGGIDIADLFANGLLMGDEEHTRQVATDKLFFSQVLSKSGESDLSDSERVALLNWLNSCRRFVHHVGCASAVAALKSASGVAGSTLVTTALNSELKPAEPENNGTQLLHRSFVDVVSLLLTLWRMPLRGLATAAMWRLGDWEEWSPPRVRHFFGIVPNLLPTG